MSEAMIGAVGLAVMFGLMVFRMPVGMAMLVVGYFGTWVMNGGRSAEALLVTETYSATSNYSLTVLPLFILMGNVASAAGFSRKLYDAAFAWVGMLRGGLAMASVLGCAVFAAVSGSSVATAVTIGRVVLPEMKRFNYSDRLGHRRHRRWRHTWVPDPTVHRLRALRDPHRGEPSASCSWRGFYPVCC